MRLILLILILLLPNQWSWPVSTPEKQGLDSQLIDKAVLKMESLQESYSFLIVRNGFLISENYFHGALDNQPHHVRSATKTIMSILVGIAIDKGYIANTSQTLDKYFPALEGAEKISIQHLLDMKAGFKWNEHQGDLLTWQNAPNPSKYLFEKKLEHNPGEKFAYNSAGVHLISHIILKSTGLSPDKFADKFLFHPLNINDTRWMKLEDGLVNGGYGLEIKPRDLAKIGNLFVNKGKWQNKQIISEDWISHSLKKNVAFNKPFGDLEDSGYGNLWWNGMINNTDVFFALGYAGQYLAVVPDLEIVIVATQQWGLSDSSMKREDFITELIKMTTKAIIK